MLFSADFNSREKIKRKKKENRLKVADTFI